MEKLDQFAVLGGRILLALIFVAGGVGKLMDGGVSTIPYMEAGGVPGFLFWPTALFELFAGLAIMAGYRTKLVALILAGFCLVTALLFHTDFSQAMQMPLFMKNLSMAGGFLILMRFGAGEFSMDNKGTPSEV